MEVETGSGSETSTSYVTVEFADQYLLANSLWTQPTDPLSEDYDSAAAAQLIADKELALEQATQGIDLMYGKSFVGEPITTTQSLEWPRTFTIYGLVPTKLKQAVCELAVDIINGGSSVRDLNSLARVTERNISGAGFSKSEKYSDASVTEYRAGMLKVELLLQKLVEDLDNTYSPAYFNR